MLRPIQNVIGSSLLFLSLFIVHVHLVAAPHNGDQFKLKQPDGSMVKVRVWGDEYYQRVETPEGYTLIRDAEGWICYAKLSANGNELVATDLKFTGSHSPLVSQLQLSKGLAINPASCKARAMAMLRKREVDEEGARLIRCGLPLSERKGRMAREDIVGLTLLIDFSDEVAEIPQTDMDDFCNKVGWTGYNNNGSAHDYFWDVSANQLNYTCLVTQYYRAKEPMTYYDTPEGKPKELVTEALNGIDAAGFDFSQLTTENGRVLAVNVLHAGWTSQGWSQGLWPHSGSISSLELDGVTLRRYQLTGIGTWVSIGTFCHENGHMVCGYPDLYDYDQDSWGVGSFCLMGKGAGGRNPIPFNPYFRDINGWETVTDITDAVPGTVYKHVANSLTSFIYKNPANADECFYIDSRVHKGRNENYPDEGLVIWHVDAKGNNSYQEMTPERHYKVSVEQADFLFELEGYVNQGEEDDLFHAGHKDVFNDTTKPDAKWWDGSASGLDIRRISEVGDTMSFTIGDVIPIINAYKINKNSITLHGSELVIYKNNEPVSVGVYDIHGRRLFHNEFRASESVVRYDKRKFLANGTYVYKISIGERVFNKRFIVSK
jgi:M6 family metalloprotease-like protein